MLVDRQACKCLLTDSKLIISDICLLFSISSGGLVSVCCLSLSYWRCAIGSFDFISRKRTKICRIIISIDSLLTLFLTTDKFALHTIPKKIQQQHDLHSFYLITRNSFHQFFYFVLKRKEYLKKTLLQYSSYHY